MNDELDFEQLMKNDLELLDRQMRKIDAMVDEAISTLEGNMKYTVGDKEGEVTALGDNGVLELLVEMQNNCYSVIYNARQNVRGKPA